MLTAWALQGKEHEKMLTELSREQERDGTAAVDSCFLGEGVCGKRRWKAELRARWGTGFEPKRKENSGREYRFGCGSMRAVETWGLEAQVGEVRAEISVDIVSGAFPFLLGDQFQHQFRLVIDTYKRQVLQHCTGGLQCVGSYRPQCMPGISISPAESSKVLAGEKGELGKALGWCRTGVGWSWVWWIRQPTGTSGGA